MTTPKEEQKHTDLLPTAVIERLRKYADEGDAETDHWIDIHGDIHILLNYIEATRKADRPVTPEGKPIFGKGSAWDIKSYLAGVASVKADCHEELVFDKDALAGETCRMFNSSFLLGWRARQHLAKEIGGEALIKYMTQRFLGWKLPADFHPDGGIVFNSHHQGAVGTNLLTATQAESMVRYMLEGFARATNHQAEKLQAVPEREETLPCAYCDGNGWNSGSEAGCCGNATSTGECCGNAIEVQVQLQCEACGGSGQLPAVSASLTHPQPDEAKPALGEDSTMAKLRALLETIAKRPNLPNPDLDADWKNCQKWSQRDAREALALLPHLASDKALVEAAQAVVDRWNEPTWKDVPATANYIYRLRDALAALAKGGN